MITLSVAELPDDFDEDRFFEWAEYIRLGDVRMNHHFKIYPHTMTIDRMIIEGEIDRLLNTLEAILDHAAQCKDYDKTIDYDWMIDRLYKEMKS